MEEGSLLLVTFGHFVGPSQESFVVVVVILFLRKAAFKNLSHFEISLDSDCSIPPFRLY
jgi:hypothetical protein